MSIYREFVANVDLGIIGIRQVSVDYTVGNDKVRLVSVYMWDGFNIVFELTDYLSDYGSDTIFDLCLADWEGYKNELAESLA